MSRIRLTEQTATPPAPVTDAGKKTVDLFAEDSAGTLVPKAIDSDGNEFDFEGPQGTQGIQGIQGPTGPPGTLAVQTVADINNPTELEGLTLLGVGTDIIAHQVIGAGISDVTTMYLYDDDGPAKNAPFVMNTGDGGTTRWIASGGRFFNNPINSVGNINNRNMTTDGTKLDGIPAGAEVNPDVVPQAEAETGTATTERIWTAERVKQAIASLSKVEMLITGGISNLSADSINKVFWGEVGADASIRMPFAGVVFAISLSLEGSRTAGTCIASFLINDVLQNGAGEETIVNGTNPDSNHQNLASPVPFSAGDILDMQATTTGFAPTSSDATIAIFIRRT